MHCIVSLRCCMREICVLDSKVLDSADMQMWFFYPFLWDKSRIVDEGLVESRNDLRIFGLRQMFQLHCFLRIFGLRHHHRLLMRCRLPHCHHRLLMRCRLPHCHHRLMMRCRLPHCHHRRRRQLLHYNRFPWP